MSEEKSVNEKVAQVIDETGVVKVRLQGACSHCPHSAYTLYMAIEQRLKEAVPEVKGVENVQ